MLDRIPVRARLTAVFALAMLVVLVGAALFVHERLESDLNEAVDAGLQSRADDLAALATRAPQAIAEPVDETPLIDADEAFAQVLDQNGLVSASGGARQAVLSADEARRAARKPLVLERRVPGIEGTARMVARPAGRGVNARLPGDQMLVVVAGQTLEERDETLAGVTTSFAVGGPIAVLLASLAGYFLAGLGLAPVEAMRRRAERISLSRAGERLPLPSADDEIRRLGETLNEMLERLHGSFERERRFVADASHELRTPLAVLKTELESALRTAGEDRREGLAAAVDEVDHLIQLADDLLLLAHAGEGEGRLRVEPEPMDVRELLERARDRFADRAREHGRSLVVEAPEGLTARLDPLRMRQALGNLVDNALRHGGGTVSLTARAGADQGRDVLEIEVADEGEGFADDIVPRAFERFARDAAGRTHGGSGLGLAIVRAIAEAHDGRAELVNGRGGGAVRLTLPL